MKHYEFMVNFLTDEEINIEMFKAFYNNNEELFEILCNEEFIRKIKQMEGK